MEVGQDIGHTMGVGGPVGLMGMDVGDAVGLVGVDVREQVEVVGVDTHRCGQDIGEVVGKMWVRWRWVRT